MKGSLHDAEIYLAKYLLKIVIALMAISLIGYAYINLILNFRMELVGIMKNLLSTMFSLIPLAVIAFMAGYCPSGSKDRFEVRIMLNLLVATFIIFIIHSISMDAGSIWNSGGGIEARETHIHIDFTKFSYTLVVLPILSIMDAYFEYRDNKDVPNGISP